MFDNLKNLIRIAKMIIRIDSLRYKFIYLKNGRGRLINR